MLVTLFYRWLKFDSNQQLFLITGRHPLQVLFIKNVELFIRISLNNKIVIYLEITSAILLNKLSFRFSLHKTKFHSNLSN